MNKKQLTAIVIGVVIIGSLGLSVFSTPSRQNSYTPPPSSPNATQTTPVQTANTDTGTNSGTPVAAPTQAPNPNPAKTGPTAYTMTQVATHNSAASCWSAINSNVYDLTSWISRHPGGEGAILSICGKDGSEAFNGQHGDDRRPQQILASFKIGALAQ